MFSSLGAQLVLNNKQQSGCETQRLFRRCHKLTTLPLGPETSRSGVDKMPTPHPLAQSSGQNQHTFKLH